MQLSTFKRFSLRFQSISLIDYEVIHVSKVTVICFQQVFCFLLGSCSLIGPKALNNFFEGPVSFVSLKCLLYFGCLIAQISGLCRSTHLFFYARFYCICVLCYLCILVCFRLTITIISFPNIAICM